MSAIAGIYNLNQQPVDRATLIRMIDVLEHRGSDDSGVWLNGSVGFGHRMLWTTPESLIEKLPAEMGHWVITADARLDNREELIQRLRLDRSRKIADSELILAAYQKWGEACPAKLLGDFAFVIWDQQHQTLFCARDPMGVRSFYYYYDRHCFVFGSEIKALFCLPEVPRQMNELRLAQYLMRDFEDREITFYQNIQRLPAAHTLTIRLGQFQMRSYWSLDPDREICFNSDEEYVEAYREIFNQAVRCRMRSAFPVGSMLSGGLDSSSIACTARNLLSETNQRSLHTFSTSFSSLSKEQLQHIDERFYVEKVLEQGGFTPHIIEADRLDPFAKTDQMFHHIDEGFCAPNLYLNWAWYETAQQNQVRVVLDGIDGDTTVSHGHAYLSDLVRTFQWKKFAHEAKFYAARFGLSYKRVLWEWGVLSLLPGEFWKQRELFASMFHPAWKQFPIHPEFAERMKLAHYSHSTLKKRLSTVSVHTARQIHWHGLNSGLLQYALELADKTASAFSVELRYPFCDRRLMEFCLALPAEQKFSRGWTRLIARRAMKDVLPIELQTRLTKADLGTNFRPKLLQYQEERLQQLIDREIETLTEYLDIKRVRQVYENYRNNPNDEDGAMTIYGMLNLANWIRKESEKS